VAGSDQFQREVLSRYANVAPADWRFSRGEHGKPGLLDSPRPLDFNLSHSGDWLACAITAGTAVGLDIEYCDPDRDVLKLARRFFQTHEIAALQACNREEQTARFYDYWTLKEARERSGEILMIWPPRPIIACWTRRRITAWRFAGCPRRHCCRACACLNWAVLTSPRENFHNRCGRLP